MIINHHSTLLNPLHCALYNPDLNGDPRDNQPSLGSTHHGVSPLQHKAVYFYIKKWAVWANLKYQRHHVLPDILWGDLEEKKMKN